MSRAIETRLRKLEAVAEEPEGDLIPIYSDPWKFEETVDALISRGDIRPEHRPRCRWWLNMPPGNGSLEERLERLSTMQMLGLD